MGTPLPDQIGDIWKIEQGQQLIPAVVEVSILCNIQCFLLLLPLS
jgi:hypothetical protein